MVDLDRLDTYGKNWTDLQAYGRWLGMPGCHNRASKVPSAPHAERLAALWNAYPAMSSELRQLRRENERLRAVAEAAKKTLADSDWWNPSEDGMDWKGPLPTWVRQLRAALKALEAP